MSDENTPMVVLGEDGAPDTSNDLVVFDRNGDTPSQGTRMIERESYEVLIEGLRVAAEACHQMVRQESEMARPDETAKKTYRLLGLKLDQVRRAAVQKAGIGFAMKENATNPNVRVSGLTWRNERERLRDGLSKASGAARQLAVAFRSEMSWLLVAQLLENMVEKLKVAPTSHYRPGMGGVLVPGRDF